VVSCMVGANIRSVTVTFQAAVEDRGAKGRPHRSSDVLRAWRNRPLSAWEQPTIDRWREAVRSRCPPGAQRLDVVT
jgi:hypothetical protein